MRTATLGAVVALLALGCAAAQPETEPIEVASFASVPGFQPYEELVPQADRKLAIMAEGTGVMTSGQRFYYIAYMTREELPNPEPGGDYPLRAETRALWQKRRLTLDPAEYDAVFIDARVFPGTPGSRTRRAAYGSKDGHWSSEELASFVFEESDLQLP